MTTCGLIEACDREPEGRFASASAQIEELAEALGLPSVLGEAPRERGTSSSPGLDAGLALPPTAISHRSLFRGQNTRRTLVAGALLLTAGAAALLYRASNAHRIDASAFPKTPATASADPGVSPIEVGEALVPPPVNEPPAVTAGPVASTLPDKAGARTPRVGTVAVPRQAPIADPFKDQK